MSGPLDELREAIVASEEFLFGGEIPCRSLTYVIRAIDAFEAAHPGLVDLSKRNCRTCGLRPCPVTVMLDEDAGAYPPEDLNATFYCSLWRSRCAAGPGEDA